MPVIANAKKALRQDRRRAIVNAKIRRNLYNIIKRVKAQKEEKLLPELYSILDRAAKKNIVHKNKAARLKSRLTHLVISAS